MSAVMLPTEFEPLMASTPKEKRSVDEEIFQALTECAMKLESIAVMEGIKDDFLPKKEHVEITL